jgi:hypothetical protein
MRNHFFNVQTKQEDHFSSAHFLCEHESCLEKKFTVFANEIELKAHTVIL